MKFNFRKIISVFTSAVMLGSTIGIASAAAYPSPFIKSGAADVAIVIGAKAATIDNIAAVDIASNLQAELAKQTATTTASSGATATGGDSVNLATSSQKLYFNGSLADARTSVTKNELPTLLADGKVLDDTGTEYSYKQSINPGSRRIAYSTSGGDLNDPALLIAADTDANNYLYQYSLTFNKNLNVSSADAQGNDLTILGKTFTVGASSTATGSSGVLYLYGSGTSKTLSEGETASVDIGGTTYSVKVSSVEQISSVNYVSVSVDGSEVRRIQEGTSSKVGGIEVYAKTIHYLAKEAQVSYVDLNLGTAKLKIGTTSGASTVKLGSDETSIVGTEGLVKVSSGAVSSIILNVSMSNSLKDYILAGGSFTDPVFGGLQLQFASVDPALDSTARDKVVVDTDNSKNAKVTFTSALAGDSGEKTFYFAHDDDATDSAIRMLAADSANRTIHVREGEQIAINEQVLVNAGDYGRILQLTEVPTGDLEATSKIQLQDFVTGKSMFEGGLTVGTSGQATSNVDGQSYKFKVYNGSTSNVSITWGASASYGNNGTGSATTLFPRIKLAKGEWMVLLYPTNLSTTITGTTTLNGVFALPGVETLSTYESPGSGLAATGSGGFINNNSAEGGYGSAKFGNLNYTIDFAKARNNTIVGIDLNEDGSLVPGTDCIFNNTAVSGAAVLIIEEKKTTESNNANNGDALCINLDKSGSTTPVEVSVAQPEYSIDAAQTTAWSDLSSLTSDSNKQQAVTRYGTFVEYDSTDNDKVTIKYPDEQMYADLLLTAVGAEVTTTSSGGSVAELGSVAVMDSEIDTVSSKNLIAVGGSCINTVAAKLLGSDSAICGADFTNKTGISADQFLIEVMDSPYATGKVAMLVAGYEGADTRKAATYLTANKPATTVGTTLKKQTATYADVV